MNFYFVKDQNLNLKSNEISRYTSIELTDYAIPASFYNIDVHNNSFYINDTLADILITLTPGNYTSTTLIAELQTQLNNFSSGFTITKNDTTRKITIARTSNFSLLFGTYSNDFSNIADVFGFLHQDYGPAGSLTSVNVTNLRPYPFLLIKCQETGTSGNIRHISNSVLPGNSLFSINLNNFEFGDMIVPESNYKSQKIKLDESFGSNLSITFDFYFYTQRTGELISVNFNGIHPILYARFL